MRKGNLLGKIFGIALVFVLVGAMLTLAGFASQGQILAQEARTWHVDDDLADYPDADFTKIQEAVDAASPEDTIIVYPGTYTENVDLNKPVALTGDETPLVDGGGKGSGITVTAHGCIIDGFGITGAGGGWHAGIKVLSDNNTLANNVCYDNVPAGIYLLGSNGNTLRNNDMHRNHFNLAVINGYTHDIDTSNTVDGKPIYYLLDEDGVLIDSSTNAGLVAAVNCTDITVKDLTLSHNRQGVLFVNTQDSRIEEVYVRESYESLMLVDSSSNLIIGCAVSDSGKFGVFLEDSNDNTIRHNTFSNNPIGMSVRGSSNTIYHNNITGSETGNAAYDFTGANSWDDGSAGNYWSDYEERYPGAEEVDETGIWDTPYEIPGDAGATDDYPLMEPYLTNNPPVAVGLDFIEDQLVMAYGYKAGEGVGGWTVYNPEWAVAHPEWNTLTTLYVGRGYWLNVSGVCDLTYGANTYQLDAGWNLIGWLGW